jgi:hypothetical protein
MLSHNMYCSDVGSAVVDWNAQFAISYFTGLMYMYTIYVMQLCALITIIETMVSE